MNQCDLIVCLGARFDDRVTGRLDAFAPNSKIHVDIDRQLDQQDSCGSTCRSSAIVGRVMEDMITIWGSPPVSEAGSSGWWAQIDGWRRARASPIRKDKDEIMPQEAIERLYEADQGRTRSSPPKSASTRCGRRSTSTSMKPNKWLTSGGLGTMGYGCPPRSARSWAIPMRW
jgi:acetolactate synthase-1/2/3 large subunit